jgi:hypothetical protein
MIFVRLAHTFQDANGGFSGNKIPTHYVAQLRSIAREKLNRKRQLDAITDALGNIPGADAITGILGQVGAAGGAAGMFPLPHSYISFIVLTSPSCGTCCRYALIPSTS